MSLSDQELSGPRHPSLKKLFRRKKIAIEEGDLHFRYFLRKIERMKEKGLVTECRGFYTPAATKAEVSMAQSTSGFVHTSGTQLFRKIQRKGALDHDIYLLLLLDAYDNLECIFRV